jgi:hypothetical protein
MPYILEERKPHLDLLLRELAEQFQNRGELNYAMTRLCCLTLLKFTDARYEDREAIRGTIACVGDEWYRRVLVNYEDDKITENGDVYEPELTERQHPDQGVWPSLLRRQAPNCS